MDFKDDFHEVTTTEARPTTDVRHATPYDKADQHVWWNEPPTADGVLTQDGITQIAYHKYKAGTYTNLDNALNPLWQGLTERLPMTAAPNTITALGGLSCLISYMVTWWYVPSWSVNEAPPNWVHVFNGVCTAIYYTLDCMDGKQARRTGSSSPLGQLFDHGVDCICVLALMSMIQCWWLTGATRLFFVFQACLQVAFFVAQWEEYITGVLPHAQGQIGVTECIYGLALASMVYGIWEFPRTVLLTVLLENTDEIDESSWLPPLVQKILRTAMMDDTEETIQVRHVLLLLSSLGTIGLIVLSMTRVLQYITSVRDAASALTKLFTPTFVAMLPLFLPLDIIQRETRFVSVTVGMVMCLITIKLIVFGMARQSYAVIQLEALPTVVVLLSIRSDKRWTVEGVHALLVLLSAVTFVRLRRWTSIAMRQICERLEIKAFSIPPPPSKDKSKKKV